MWVSFETTGPSDTVHVENFTWKIFESSLWTQLVRGNAVTEIEMKTSL